MTRLPRQVATCILILVTVATTATAAPIAALRQAPKSVGLFASLSGATNFATASAEVDWADGYHPTDAETMRDNARLGLQLRGGLLAAGRFRAGLALSYHARLPNQSDASYGLFGAGVHLAWQDDPTNAIAWGVGLDVEKLFSTTDAIDTSGGVRFYPHLVWDFYVAGSAGNRHGLQFRLGFFFESGMQGPPMTEMANDVSVRPQLELGWVWAGF